MSTKPDEMAELIDRMCKTWDHSYGLMPEDSRASLRLCIGQLVQHDIGPFVARAIMSAEKRGEEREREACAQVAYSEANSWADESKMYLQEASACMQVEAAIRKRGEH